LFKKIVKIQAGLKANKEQYNSFGKYNYRSCEDILEAVKPLLKEQELFLKITDDIVLIGDRFYVKSTASLSDGTNEVSTTAFAREPLDKKGMDVSQITGATSSYARKYALNGLFGIDDAKDSDHYTANNVEQNENKKPEKDKKEQDENNYKCPKCNKDITKGAFENFGMCIDCKQKGVKINE